MDKVTMDWCTVYTVPKVIDFPRYNTKCSGENEILRGIFRAVSRFPLQFVLYSSDIWITFWTMYTGIKQEANSI